ncbi:twitching motility protein PilT [Enterobacter bugandensis]|nr:twitching motility protein PilT [Enterobacter bugandensis]
MARSYSSRCNLILPGISLKFTCPQNCVLSAISATTYSEMRFGATGLKASPRHVQLVDAFCARLDGILPGDRAAVDANTEIKVALRLAGTPIGLNDTAIAGHAIAAGAILVTNNVREFERVPGLVPEDWVN